MTKKIKPTSKDQSCVDDKDVRPNAGAADELDIAALEEVSGGAIIPTSPARPYRSAGASSTTGGSSSDPGGALNLAIDAKNAVCESVMDMINVSAAARKKAHGG